MVIGEGSAPGPFRLREDWMVRPLPNRLRNSSRFYGEIMSCHENAVLDRRPNYQDPVSGFMVFTAQFLADRGYCCDSGCRHCPYEVPT